MEEGRRLHMHTDVRLVAKDERLRSVDGRLEKSYIANGTELESKSNSQDVFDIQVDD